MNHIYKTIFNKRTGQIAVVSEKASNQSRSQNGSDQKKERSTENKSSSFVKAINKNTLTTAIIIILGSSTTFAAIEYTGNSSDLTTSQSIGGNFNQLIGNSTANGVTEFNSNSPYTPLDSNADVTINYSSATQVPDFVIAGSTFASMDSILAIITASNNQITLEQGAINGPIYAGLAHATSITGDIDCATTPSKCTNGAIKTNQTINNKGLTANNNKIILVKDYSTNNKNDFYSGYAAINPQFGNLTAANADANADADADANAYVYPYAYAYADAYASASDNTISSNQNSIIVQGSENNANDIAICWRLEISTLLA